MSRITLLGHYRSLCSKPRTFEVVTQKQFAARGRDNLLWLNITKFLKSLSGYLQPEAVTVARIPGNPAQSCVERFIDGIRHTWVVI